jgi:iron complex transport system ATP-binding protein
MEPLLTLNNVSFNYEASRTLRGINLQVHRGELLGILGPNGSGKTTLLKIMDGILAPNEGEILVNGRSLLRLGRKETARRIAMVSQENYFGFDFSVLEVVLMGRFPHLGRLQFEGDRDVKVALKALDATHTRSLAARSIHRLSGGEKQRVLIARALAQEPQLILLDEPTSFLDIKYKREIFQLISTLSEDRGLAVVVVTHDLDLTAQYCQRLVLLKEGEIYQMGDPATVITPSNIRTVYDCPVLVDRNPATGTPRVSLEK